MKNTSDVAAPVTDGAPQAARIRDTWVARLARVNRRLIGAAAVLIAAFSELAAQTAPGKTLGSARTAGVSRASPASRRTARQLSARRPSPTVSEPASAQAPPAALSPPVQPPVQTPAPAQTVTGGS